MLWLSENPFQTNTNVSNTWFLVFRIWGWINIKAGKVGIQGCAIYGALYIFGRNKIYR